MKPMVTTTLDGTPTFLSPPTPLGARCSLVDRKSREELQVRGNTTFLFHSTCFVCVFYLFLRQKILENVLLSVLLLFIVIIVKILFLSRSLPDIKIF